ncbi:hypothetical protein EET67_05250 [Pseudaminobacter arsenicus]|uniref:Uncharacterized protein n=1 Tax=Borborobacter arsenicus TaxID=1851146 RepID=A0A432VAC1_9HYPH|nr:hypothetical protein [Pseudaminobacter arsenicus]RUM99045.1 hypothetical protein EET67_05250 [Pseudaminobacter arsenicus]
MTVELMGAIGFLVMLAGALFGQYKWWSGSIGKVRDDLAAHKLHVAESYVTKAGMSEQTAQIMKAIEGIGNRIDGISERLDRAFERTPRSRS